MSLYGILDARRGKGWVWTDSVFMERKRSLDNLIAWVEVFPRYKGKTREQQLRIARREGLRVVKVRLEVIA